MEFSEPFVPRHPWLAALLLATAFTPAGVILAWLAPRPLDAFVALPLVVLDIWAGSEAGEALLGASPVSRPLLLGLGIGLTWLLYVIAARLMVRRLVPRDRAPRG